MISFSSASFYVERTAYVSIFYVNVMKLKNTTMNGLIRVIKKITKW